ncbi:MAG: APC family permease [Thermogemmatispora sp.]|uniref:APC family permease n=1 Tax=Thermogemmatispora sp. TaxID=1968838 RepID=UPI002639E255|nr:APC family permease [Thermogemmatispora sp.]MBX5457637.1 APC family permease [Thermogemmatispora sp.]
MTTIPQLRPHKPLTAFAIAGSTMAQIAPAFSFYLGMAVITQGAGEGAPFTILLAAIAIFIVGSSVAAFAQRHPSNGSLVTFLGLTFGGVIGTATAVLFSVAYILLLASVMLAIGGWVSFSLQTFYGLSVPWLPLTIVLALLCWLLTVSGINRSTAVATASMIIEVAVLLVVAFLAFLHPPAPLSLTPLLPSALQNGLTGLGQAFPLAVFLFIGFENAAALAEESEHPRRNIPRAVMLSLVFMAALYLIVSYATVTGFGNSASRLAQSTIPFIDLAQRYLGPLAILAALAGFTSVAGTMLAGTNNLSRVIFNSARERLFPYALAQVSDRFGTPILALTLPFALALVLALAVGLAGSDWLSAFGYLSTLGTIPLILIYGAVNVAVIFNNGLGLSPLRRYVLPLLGTASIAVPLWALVQPGQQPPYSFFPWIILALLIAALLYSWWRVRSDPALPGRIGAFGPEGLAEAEAVAISSPAASVAPEEESDITALHRPESQA